MKFGKKKISAQVLAPEQVQEQYYLANPDKRPVDSSAEPEPSLPPVEDNSVPEESSSSPTASSISFEVLRNEIDQAILSDYTPKRIVSLLTEVRAFFENDGQGEDVSVETLATLKDLREMMRKQGQLLDSINLSIHKGGD